MNQKILISNDHTKILYNSVYLPLIYTTIDKCSKLISRKFVKYAQYVCSYTEMLRKLKHNKTKWKDFTFRKALHVKFAHNF